jgi:hypothetical protein
VEGTSVQFTFQASEPSSFECSIHAQGAAAAFEACTTSGYTASSLTPGTYRFEVRATDAVGNTGPVAQRTFIIKAPPATTTGSSAGGGPTTDRSGTPGPRGTPSGPDGTSGGTPAALALAVPARVKIARKVAVAKGIAYTAACTVGCTVTGTLSVDAKTAKTLRLSASLQTAIGSATLKLAGAGSGKLVIKLSTSAKAALSKARRITLVLTTTAADATGHKVSKTTTVTLV